jgi:hypothetical protein
MVVLMDVVHYEAHVPYWQGDQAQPVNGLYIKGLLSCVHVSFCGIFRL